MKVTLGEETYELDVEQAKKLGILKPLHVVKDGSIVTGDIFKNSNCNKLVLVKCLWTSGVHDTKAKAWQFLGLWGKLIPYSDAKFKKLWSYEDAVKYLEEERYMFHRNINLFD
tara:strand:+ start:316 stop:654 length:339 start_codon:yes stop_codon:yes gene_type:complete